MDDLNITMEEYIRLEEENARRRAIVLNDALTSEVALSCEPTVSPLNDNQIDFIISFEESDDEDYTVIYDKNSFSYKIISVDDLKTDSENDNDKVNMPSFPSPEPTVSYFDDLDYFKDFEKEFPSIVYNDALTYKLDFLTEPTVSPQNIDEFNLKDETSFSECNEEEQNVLYFNDLFSFNVIYPGDSKSDKDNDDIKIDIKQSSRVFEMTQRSFDAVLRSALERIVTASGDWFWGLAMETCHSASLQTKLLRHSGIVSSGPAFNDALCAFNTKMKTALLSNTSVPLFSVLKSCSACSKVFTGDIYGDHAVSCAEVDIGLGGGRDKPLRPADMLLYSWDEGLDVCVDLTGSSPLTQTGMVDFVPGRLVIDAAHHKRVKYEAKCADIEYGFLPFSFSSLGELEKDAVTLLKRIRKFSMTQDIEARAVVHILNRTSFAIAKGVGAQLVSRLPTNFL
ncbi:hypothetical protein Tco_0481051 [Tanacetum coccineum]